MPEAFRSDHPRIFEQRIYESHNEERAKRKIEMFNRGKIEIFRDVDRTPIFFGETLVGEHMPNLTYMVVFEDTEHRNEVGEAFGNHPGWQEMPQDPYYADTVSNISSIMLRSTEYSQI